MKRMAQLVALLLVAAGVCFAGEKPAEKTSTSPPSTSHAFFVATLRNGFSIRFDHREQRETTSRLYLSTGSDSFLDVPTAEIAELRQEEVPAAAPEAPPTPASVDIPTAIAAASDRHGIDADLLYSVIRAESDFNPRAVSPKGACGLMQLMPPTAGKLGVADSFDAASNVEAGTRYLRELLDRYHYDLAKALAAYNAGPARVDQYHGVPPFHETRVYVARIIHDYNRAVLSRRKIVAGKHSSAISLQPSVANRNP
jgi:soluble lytic murein transglycosylase-like protein